jgi:16S rRNA (uracil1498-N3)-methyltransferase
MHTRFFIKEKIDKGQKDLVVSDLEMIHQISRVLRKKAGDKIIILDNSGTEYECQISQINKKLVLLKIAGTKKNINEPDIKISLYQSLIKKNKMDFVFEKCTEAGVSEFYPVVSGYSVKISFSQQRAEKILKEASEQSRRGKVPNLHKLEKFEDAILKCQKDDLNILFYESEKKETLIDFIFKNRDKFKKSKNINIFVGPEGGFSESEVKLAKDSGFEILSLGKRILRAETAAIVSSAFLALA